MEIEFKVPNSIIEKSLEKARKELNLPGLKFGERKDLGPFYKRRFVLALNEDIIHRGNWEAIDSYLQGMVKVHELKGVENV